MEFMLSRFPGLKLIFLSCKGGSFSYYNITYYKRMTPTSPMPIRLDLLPLQLRRKKCTYAMDLLQKLPRGRYCVPLSRYFIISPVRLIRHLYSSFSHVLLGTCQPKLFSCQSPHALVGT